MTTSGVTAWAMTAADLVSAALKEAAIIDPGAEPEAVELADSLVRLNGMLKSWSIQGVSLFREQSLTVTTTAATASVTLNANVRAISSVRVVESATNERRLWPINRTDYLSLPNKTAAGSPTMYYLDRQRDAAVFYLWPVSATVKTLKLDYDKYPETVTAGAETIDIRQELLETVWTNLAVRIAPIFGGEASASVQLRAKTLETQMFDAERPDSYRFETDYDYA